MKHIDLRAAWMQLLRDRSICDVVKVDGTANPADFFTKLLGRKDFSTYEQQLMQNIAHDQIMMHDD